MDINKITEWNNDQIDHIKFVQKGIMNLCNALLANAIQHDSSKFYTQEYKGFLGFHESLKKSQDGLDKDYQKALSSEAVQLHYKFNEHHPEYWKNHGLKMPLVMIIEMYFDWLSRSTIKSMDGKKSPQQVMDDFWEYNKQKLIDTEQEHAIPIVEMLMREFPVIK